MGRAANPVDATLGGPDDLLEGVASEIGQLAALALEVAPQRLGRVELRASPGSRSTTSNGAGWQGTPASCCWDGPAAIPQQGRLLPTQEAPQLAQHADQAVGVVAAGLDMEGELAAATSEPTHNAAAIEARFQLHRWTSTGVLPRGAQVERTIGVSETPDSSKQQMTALPRLAFF